LLSEIFDLRWNPMTTLPAIAKALRTHGAHALGVVRTLTDAGYQTLLAGGCVRDLLLGQVPSDYDVATNARPEEVLRLFPSAIGVGIQFGVVVVPTEGGNVEVAAFRTEGPYIDGRHPSSVTFADAQSDAERRDFTINGLFYDPGAGRVLDYVDGRNDLERGVVRAIGDPAARFKEDRLRLVRTARFAGRLGFEIDPATATAVRAEAAHVRETSAERLRDELATMLRGPGVDRSFRALEDLALLPEVLPEAAAMKDVPQPPEFHPEGDVWSHVLLCLSHLRVPSEALAWGVLLHDVGKPPTFERAADRIRFHNHAPVGAEMARGIARRLRFPNALTEAVVSLVNEHMRFKDLPDMRLSRLRRWLADPLFDEHLELHRIDCLSSHGNLSVWEFARDRMREFEGQPALPPRLLTGHDLIAMGLEPGPEFGRILRAAHDAQLEGRITTKEEALRYAKTHRPERSGIPDAGG
jgi:poly(A) polymerase